MTLLSVNVSLGRAVVWQGRSLETGIFKEPVAGPVMVRKHQMEGDRQADLTVHGGEFMAVYAYSAEHYPWWRKELGQDLPPGAFGENLTIAGFDEEAVCVGDAYRVGGALLEAVQPRLPCRKLAAKFSDEDIVKRFMDSGRWGVYFRVLEEGPLRAGDAVRLEREGPGRLPVPELARLRFAEPPDRGRLRAALGLKALCPDYRRRFEARLAPREG